MIIGSPNLSFLPDFISKHPAHLRNVKTIHKTDWHFKTYDVLGETENSIFEWFFIPIRSGTRYPQGIFQSQEDLMITKRI